jgi:hypothetical protein
MQIMGEARTGSFGLYSAMARLESRIADGTAALGQSRCRTARRRRIRVDQRARSHVAERYPWTSDGCTKAGRNTE